MKKSSFIGCLTLLLIAFASCIKNEYPIYAGSIAIDGTEIYFKYTTPQGLEQCDTIDIFARGITPNEPIYIITSTITVGDTISAVKDSILQIPFSTTVSFDNNFSSQYILELRKGSRNYPINLTKVCTTI